ncbi:MAG: hypothetical protein A3E87_01580 [Gammaproteobacteria bacterium RIFCSPHIGHO2_12_FULL_35_23]|nr:MAG: hypothetical protein A3E87_01580 [Gammaproteobacteria bacterium RIFCSPHIGHO2_12_FULL_35_23]
MTEKYSPAFLYAVDHTLAKEGYFSNHSWDPGGKTKYGITEEVAIMFNKDVEKLTKEDAIYIYWKAFWNKMGCEKINSWYIASEIFDTAVNMGPITAGNLIQRTLNDIFDYNLKVDGIIGSHSINAINDVCRHYEANLLGALNGFQFTHYLSLQSKNPTLYKKAIKGWCKRVLPELKPIDYAYWESKVC